MHHDGKLAIAFFKFTVRWSVLVYLGWNFKKSQMLPNQVSSLVYILVIIIIIKIILTMCIYITLLFLFYYMMMITIFITLLCTLLYTTWAHFDPEFQPLWQHREHAAGCPPANAPHLTCKLHALCDAGEKKRRRRYTHCCSKMGRWHRKENALELSP